MGFARGRASRGFFVVAQVNVLFALGGSLPSATVVQAFLVSRLVQEQRFV
jgi:hypothetical protein